MYRDRRQFNKAVLTYKKAVISNPYFAESHYNLANVFGELGRYDEAFSCCNEAIKLKPNYYLGYNALGGLFIKTDRLDEGTKSLKKAIDLCDV